MHLGQCRWINLIASGIKTQPYKRTILIADEKGLITIINKWNRDFTLKKIRTSAKSES